MKCNRWGRRLLAGTFVVAAWLAIPSQAFAWTEQKVTAPDAAPNAWFGTQTVIDGDFAFVSAMNATVNGNASQGAVYVYKKDANGIWNYSEKLTASDGTAFAWFGAAVVAKGDVLFISAPQANLDGKNLAGSVYYFLHLGNHWGQVQRLNSITGVTATETFGVSLALNSGNLFVGTGGAQTAGQYVPRKVQVFTPSIPGPFGNDWAGVQVIDSPLPNEISSGGFGASLAAVDGTMMASARIATINGNLGQGAVFVYEFDGQFWTQTDELTASDGGARDNFGVGLALDTSSTLRNRFAMIGAPGFVLNGAVSRGAVYPFQKIAGVWQEQKKLLASDGTAFNLFGASVNIDNNQVLAGAYAADSYRGAAYLFTPDGAGGWTQVNKFTASDGAANDVYGYYKPGIGNGVLLLGAYGAGSGRQGAAYFYRP